MRGSVSPSVVLWCHTYTGTYIHTEITWKCLPRYLLIGEGKGRESLVSICTYQTPSLKAEGDNQELPVHVHVLYRHPICKQSVSKSNESKNRRTYRARPSRKLAL